MLTTLALNKLSLHDEKSIFVRERQRERERERERERRGGGV